MPAPGAALRRPGGREGMDKMDGSNDIRAAFDARETLPPAAPAAPLAPDDQGPPEGAPPAVLPDCPEATAAQFPLNDYGNGQRLIEYYGADMLFVPRLGWYRWAGKRWAADEDELRVRTDAQRVAGRILGEVDHLALEDWEMSALDMAHDTRDQLAEIEAVARNDRSADQVARLAQLHKIASTAAEIRERQSKRRASHRAHAKNSGNTSKISNMLLEARTASAIGINDLNSDPLALNCENGTLQFSLDLNPHDAEWGKTDPEYRVDLVPHDRNHLISKMVPVEYDATARCPHWLRFLETVQPDAEMRGFLQRWFGYCLTGRTVEQKLAFLYGGGRNGKSTMVDTIAKILADYGTTVPIETLTGTEQRKGSDATPDLVRLPGARFVRASEPEQGQRLKEALVKALTGGESIMIRRMMQEFVEVTPEFKLTISGNYRPEIRGSDDGIWRRVMLVPFETQIAEADVDAALPDKLWAERAGILAWLVEGCLDYLKTGLRPPQAVKEATDEYRQESDPMRLFLTTECEITGAEDFERARDLSDAFNAWLLDKGEAVWGKRTVSNAIKARAGTVKGAGGMVFAPGKRSDTGYIGIRIKPAAMDRIAAYGEELRSGAARKG